jgi:hypothetical protein
MTLDGMRLSTAVAIAALVAGAAVPLTADVKTQERTQVRFEGALGRVVNFFGGRGAREGIVNTIAVQGDRMMSTNENTGEIVDLAEEKVYQLDLKRKQYTVVTFAELRKQMEDAMAKARADADKQQGRKGDDPQREYEVDVAVKETGQTRQVAGHATKESVMTITVREKGKTLEDGGMVMETSLWLAADVPALKELNDFRMRYAQKLYGPVMAQAAADMTQAMAMYPMMKDAMARFQEEGRKLQGTALSSVMRFQLAGNAQGQSAEAGGGAPPGGIGGLMGGLGRLGRRKKAEEPAAAEPGTPATPGRVTIMTTTTETLQIGTSVAAAEVALPAGFKQKS